MASLKTLNVLLSFFLEVAMLGAFGYWGYHAVENPSLRWLVAVAVPLAVALLWGLFLAPRAVKRVGSTLGITVTVLLFYLAALALMSTGHSTLGIAMMVLAAINRSFVAVWKQW